MTGNLFSATESTHGRQVRLLDSDKIKISDNHEETREIMLWDLAGQPGYRLIHQLHLNEVAVALVIFDSRSELDPFGGVRHWVRALNQARLSQNGNSTPIKKFLVAARADRGGIGVSKTRLNDVVEQYGFDGYFETSAREGWQIKELSQSILGGIEWSCLPRVSSTELFRQIKNFIVEEKRTGKVLYTEHELFGRFLRKDAIPKGIEKIRWQFSACIGRVESQGLIRKLTFGNLIVLLPELMDAYASALVHEAKAEPDGLGFILEDDAKNGKFRISSDERLKNKEQEKILITAVIEDLLRHEIALRQPSEKGMLLVFPSQLTKEWPYTPDATGTEVIFDFEGSVMNVYATLAVRLSNSGTFETKDMWRNAATYMADTGGICGLFMTDVEEGSATVTLFFSSETIEETCTQFETYVQAHLLRRAIPSSIKSRRISVCPECHIIFTDRQVKLRKERGFEWLNCCVCDKKVSLVHKKTGEAIEFPSDTLKKMDNIADSQRDKQAEMVAATAEVHTRDFRSWAGSSSATLAVVFTDIVGSTRLGTNWAAKQWTSFVTRTSKKAVNLLNNFAATKLKRLGMRLWLLFNLQLMQLISVFAFTKTRDTAL